MQAMTNSERLEEAGVIKPGHNFTQQDIEAIENLATEEVDVLISLYNQLGDEFLERNLPNGIVF